MKFPVRPGVRYIAPTFIIVLVLVIAALSLRQPKVSAGPPPPDVPDFKGEPFTAVLDGSHQIRRETVKVTVPQQGWVTLVDTDFESVNWDTDWDNFSVSSNYKYGTRSIANPLDFTSTAVAWAVGTSPSNTPPLDPAVDGYPENVDDWLVTGPHDFSDVIAAKLAFEYSFDADEGDKFRVAASTDGSKFIGPENSGGTGEWLATEWNLDSNVVGQQPQVWVAVIFTSDQTPNTANRVGLLLDNVKLYVENRQKTHLPVVAYELTPTPEDPCKIIQDRPPGEYLNEFSDSIMCWEPRIWTLGANYDLYHDNATDSERQGFLNLMVSPEQKYVFASPLVRSKPYPYNIEIEAKIRSTREDNDQYGVIFGANRTSEVCPATDFSTCFTNYYELRVRYRKNDDAKWLEYKLKRVDGNDENNQSFGKDLINWTNVDGFVDEDSWVEWDINVNADGKIGISVNDNFVGKATDTTYLDNPYFGLEARTGDVDSSEVRFDYIKID